MKAFPQTLMKECEKEAPKAEIKLTAFLNVKQRAGLCKCG